MSRPFPTCPVFYRKTLCILLHEDVLKVETLLFPMCLVCIYLMMQPSVKCNRNLYEPIHLLYTVVLCVLHMQGIMWIQPTIYLSIMW